MGLGPFQAMKEADTLRRAARILQERSTKPRSIVLGVICRFLEQTAEKIEAESPLR